MYDVYNNLYLFLASEFNLFEEMMNKRSLDNVKQLSVEIHFFHTLTKQFGRYYSLLQQLKRHGFAKVYTKCHCWGMFPDVGQACYIVDLLFVNIPLLARIKGHQSHMNTLSFDDWNPKLFGLTHGKFDFTANCPPVGGAYCWPD